MDSRLRGNDIERAGITKLGWERNKECGNDKKLT